MTRGTLPALGLRVAVIASALFGMLFVHAASTKINYAGHYELVDVKAGRSFSLDVKQTGSRAEVSFAIATADGSETAQGSGKGRMEDGVLSFKFKDNLKNEGSCTLTSKVDGSYYLSMTVIKVVDVGPFHFYGNILLKKTSDQPARQLSAEKM